MHPIWPLNDDPAAATATQSDHAGASLVFRHSLSLFVSGKIFYLK
jgi:hypothetical protein